MSAAVMILPHCCRAAEALVAVLLGVVYLQVCKSKERSSVQRTGHGGASRGERLMHGHFYDAFRVRPCSMQLCMQHATVHLDAPPPSSCFMPPQAVATDLTLEALLDTLKPAGEHFLDLSGSRLTALSLPALTAWLQQHPAARACVHCTNIGFYETCRHLMEQFSNLELIKSHRLAFSVDEAGRKLDSLHAGAFLQGRTVGLAEALAQVQGSLQATAASLQRVQELHEQEERRRIAEQEERRRIAEQEAQRQAAEQEAQRRTTVQEAAAQRRRDAELTARIDKLNKGCQSLYSHHKSQSDSYEVLVTSLLRVHLKADGCEVFELPRCRHTLPKFLPDYEHGVEWDGVLFVPALKHLYLVEAKSNLENKYITGMPPRCSSCSCATRGGCRTVAPRIMTRSCAAHGRGWQPPIRCLGWWGRRASPARCSRPRMWGGCWQCSSTAAPTTCSRRSRGRCCATRRDNTWPRARARRWRRRTWKTRWRRRRWRRMGTG